MTKIELAEQVVQFVRALAPEPRRAVRLAIRGLSEDRGDIKALQDNLEGFYRLRVGTLRVIFHYQRRSDENRNIRCDYIDKRDLVYTNFETELRSHQEPGGD